MKQARKISLSALKHFCKDMLECLSAFANDMQEVHASTQERMKEELLRIQDVTDISKQSDKFKLKTAQAMFYKDKAECAENEYKKLTESLQQRDPEEGETDTEKCKKLTEDASALKEQLKSLRAEHEDVKKKRDFYMTLFESIPDVEKPKRDRSVGSPTSTPEAKRYKSSQPDESTDLATSKGAGVSAQSKSFPA